MVCHTKVKLSSSYRGYGLVYEFSGFVWNQIHHCFIILWQCILRIIFMVLLVIYFPIYLSGLSPYVEWFNIMGFGVINPRSGHSKDRIRHYWIFIKIMVLFTLHLWLVCHPTLIYEPYSLMYPRDNCLRGSRLPLLRHHKVKYWPRGDILFQTNVALGDILPNRI